MKIAIVTQNDRQATQAGVRIRYARLRSALARQGHELDIVPIMRLDREAAFVHDAYVICKCYDARALVLAERLSDAGRAVGVDVIDDYFSQRDQSRLSRFRYWLSELLARCSFVLCATDVTAALVAGYAPQLPLHVHADPVVQPDLAALRKVLAGKHAAAQRERRIDIAWFGMGDNPSFPVGLRDLAGFGAEIDRLRGHGYDIRLAVLTNERAITPDNLARLSRLATSYSLDTWTEQKEAELLERSFMAFLPVNRQPFSRAKSLNRAMTALAAGCQVLSAGYPLYAELDPFVYRDASALLGDMAGDHLALHTDNAAALVDHLGELANVEPVASALAEFLGHAVAHASRRSPTRLAVIHGYQSSGEIHKFVRRLDSLSVASPFCRERLNFDVRFELDAEGKGFDVLIANKQVEQVAADVQPLLTAHGMVLTTLYKRLSGAAAFPDIRLSVAALLAADTAGSRIAAYTPVMRAVQEVMRRVFPSLRCVMAEAVEELTLHASSEPAAAVGGLS